MSTDLEQQRACRTDLSVGAPARHASVPPASAAIPISDTAAAGLL